MPLIERDEPQARLLRAFEAARAGRGNTAVVAGEAGIGKTALVRQFLEVVRPRAVVLFGICDDLFTPQALAPFYDVAFELGDELVDLLASAANLRLIGHRLLGALQTHTKPTVVVIEDIQWADEATLDLIQFLGRRIQSSKVMLVLTLRESEAQTTRTAQALLGKLPTAHTQYILLSPLSRDAVNQLTSSRDHLDGDMVFQLTRGNPFYVTELVACEEDTLPRSVRDAVLARADRLSQSARRVLEAVSIVPNHAEEWLVREVVTLSDPTFTEVLDSGMLALKDGFFTFRHELARRALVETLPIAAARALHRAVFEALQSRGREVTLARRVHHAAYADLGEAVIQLAPTAARQASAVNAHREAAAHYATALRYGRLLSVDRQADLLEARAHACYLGVHWETALAVYERALALRRQAGQTERVGDILRRMSRLAWGLTRVRQARRHALEAVRTLRRRPAGKPMALAYSMLGQWHMHQSHVVRTLYWSEKAVALAESIQEAEPRIDGLVNIGTVLGKGADVPTGIRQLEESLELALKHDASDQAVRCYFNLGATLIEQQQLARASNVTEDALTYTYERDLNTYHAGMVTLTVMIALYRGDWSQAEASARQVARTLSLSEARGIAPLMCAAALTIIAARRGAPNVGDRVDDLLHQTQGHLQLAEDAGYVYLPRAEAAWLRGDHDACVAEARALRDFLRGKTYQWQHSCASFWLWRCGDSIDMSAELIEPHRLQVAGDWRAAAAAWERRGYPYEQAMALADGDQGALHQAFRILDRLGAHAAMDYVRKRLRELGSESVPRGMNSMTRINPVGLTQRQMDVLNLLAEGLTNPQVAGRLHISAKTVGHHVSAILTKLDVASREEAVEVARTLQLID